MGKTAKKWLIAAGALVLLGTLMFVLTMCLAGWNFRKLSTEKFETKTYEPSEAFRDIKIEADTADIVFSPAEDGKCRVVCYERESVTYSVSAADGTLTVRAIDERNRYIGVAFENDRITVYLPKAEYAVLVIEEKTGDVEIPHDFGFERIDISVSTGSVTCNASATGDVRIKSSTGGIRVENTSVASLDLSVSTGSVTVSDVTCGGNVRVGVTVGKTRLTNLTCKNVVSSGSTGDISLECVIAEERFTIERSTGDVSFRDCDASEIHTKTSTGNVEGDFRTEKVFVAESDTGHVDVPKTTTGGKCEIRTDTGHIRISVS